VHESGAEPSRPSPNTGRSRETVLTPRKWIDVQPFSRPLDHLHLALLFFADQYTSRPFRLEIVDVAFQRHERANGCGA